jgi:hypothetical protein
MVDSGAEEGARDHTLIGSRFALHTPKRPFSVCVLNMLPPAALGGSTGRAASPYFQPSSSSYDATVRWPEDRPQLAFGEMSLREITPNNAGEQQQIIFDPIPRVDGIEASSDPLFEPRANIYLMSGRRRRTAGERS